MKHILICFLTLAYLIFPNSTRASDNMGYFVVEGEVYSATVPIFGQSKMRLISVSGKLIESSPNVDTEAVKKQLSTGGIYIHYWKSIFSKHSSTVVTGCNHAIVALEATEDNFIKNSNEKSKRHNGLRALAFHCLDKKN